MDAPGLPPEALLAHLVSLQGLATPIGLVTRLGLELSGCITGLDPERRRMQVEVRDMPPRTLAPGDAVRVALPLGGQRWESPARVMEQPAYTQFVLSLPREAERRDRRSAPRIPIAPDAGLRALVRLGPDGPALTGPLLDLSTGGFRFQVERAFDLQTRERLDPTTLGLAQGLALDGVELTGLRSEPLEASGLLRDLDPGPILHLQFRALLRSDRAFLQDWCEARPLPSGLPTLPEPPPEPVPATTPEPPPPPSPLPLLLWMDPGHTRAALASLLDDLDLGPLTLVHELSELRRALQTSRYRAALLLGPSETLPQALGLVRALRGSRPCPTFAPFPGLPGCDHVLASPLRTGELIAGLQLL